MLKHGEDTEADAPVSAPQARVTPQELSDALAAIEARKQAEASRLAGTIPIEQAVSELHLDSSPEELWAEVQVQRGKARTEAEQAQARAAETARQEQARRQQERQQQAAQEAAARRFVLGPAPGPLGTICSVSSARSSASGRCSILASFQTFSPTTTPQPFWDRWPRCRRFLTERKSMPAALR